MEMVAQVQTCMQMKEYDASSVHTKEMTGIIAVNNGIFFTLVSDICWISVLVSIMLCIFINILFEIFHLGKRGEDFSMLEATF